MSYYFYFQPKTTPSGGFVPYVNPDWLLQEARARWSNLHGELANPFAYGDHRASVISSTIQMLVEILCLRFNEALAELINPERILREVDVQVVENAVLHLAALVKEKERG